MIRKALVPTLTLAALLACGGEAEKPAATPRRVRPRRPLPPHRPRRRRWWCRPRRRHPTRCRRACSSRSRSSRCRPRARCCRIPGPRALEILVREGGAWKVVDARGSRLQRLPQGDGLRRAGRPRDPDARRLEGRAEAVAQGRQGRLRARRDALEQGFRRQVQPHARRRDRRRDWRRPHRSRRRDPRPGRRRDRRAEGRTAATRSPRSTPRRTPSSTRSSSAISTATA